MSGEIKYRLTVVDPAGATFTPGDTAIGDDHFWVTSQRRTDHPWIAEPPSGEGESIDPVTGAVTDGEYQVRVIDVDEPVCASWTATTVVDKTALGFTNSYLSNGWTKKGTPTPGTYPEDSIHTWWTASGANPVLNGSALFLWIDTFAGPPFQLGGSVRETYIEKVITGLTPGATYGLAFGLVWSLDSGAGNIFLEIDGASGPNRLAITGPGTTIWTLGTLETDLQLRLRATATPAGEITIRIGGEDYQPSCNVTCEFTDLELAEVTCASTTGSGDRYVTQWLADLDARQRLMGRRAYVEQTTDNGTTWTMLRAGYVTALEMPESLVFDFAIGDARRVERTRSAWRDLDPPNEPDFATMTALIGGPVYTGFEPYSPLYPLPLFRCAAFQLASGDRSPGELPDGTVRFNYISGPMPPGFRHPGSQHAARLTQRTINDRAQPYWDSEENWDASAPPGAFPGLRAYLFDTSGAAAFASTDFVPLGQNYMRKQGVILSNGAGVSFAYDRGQELLNDGLEVLLRHDLTAPSIITVGAYYYLLVLPRAVSDTFPLYFRGHPVALEAALYARHGIPVNSASVTSVTAALGADLVTVQRFTDPGQTVQDVADTLHAMYGYTTRMDADGAREFVVYRRPVDTTPALSVTTDDLRAEGGPTYRLHERSRRNRLVLAQEYFRTVDFDDEAILQKPDAIEVVPATITFDYSTDGGATLDADVQGPLEERLALNGHVAWRGRLNDVLAPKATVAMSQRQWGAGLARQLFAATGRGAQEATIVTLRDAADADAARLADPLLVDAAHVPNAQLGQTPTSQRGGTHWWRVTRRTEAPEGAELQLTRSNTGVAYGEAVTLRVMADLFDPGFFYRVEITNADALYTDAAWLEVECAIGSTAPTGAGVLYTVLDAQQFTDALGAPQEPFTTRLGPFPYNEVVWVRARGFLVGGAPGAWSAWTTLGGSVTTPGSGLGNLVISFVKFDGARLDWTNGDATNQVRVSYRVDDTGAYTTFATLGIGSATSTLTGLTGGTLYGVKVVLWDGVAEVGTPLTGQFTTLAGDVSGLSVTGITASDAILNWANTHPTYPVKIEYRVTGSGAYGLWQIVPATSISARLFGLTPSTSYDVRVVLVTPGGVEFGTGDTDTFTTLGSLGTLGPPTNPRAFAGTDPASGGFSRGLYGLRVYADTTNPPHTIVIEEAVETAIASGTPGTYSEVDFLPASFVGATIWTNTTANDGKLRYLRAKARASGYSDSTTTAVQSIDPWSVSPPTNDPILSSVALLATGLAEDTSATGEFLIAPGATITKVTVTNSKSSRLQLYESGAARTADAGRAYTQLPQTGSGVLLDLVFPPGSYALDLNPLVQIIDRSGLFLSEVTVYYRITSYEPGTNDVTMTVEYILPSTRAGT